MPFSSKRNITAVMCALALGLPIAGYLLAQASATATSEEDPAFQQSEKLPLAAKSLLLDLTRNNAGFFAVGERGHLLKSEDGKTWQQIQVPTRAALTGIATQEGQVWAVGHDGVILQSPDNGSTWYRRRVAPFNIDDQSITNGAPIMDVHFADAKNGVAVGAYSLFLSTADGGVTWEERRVMGDQPSTPAAEIAVTESGNFSEDDLILDEESDPHFNSVVRTGAGTYLITGERGTMLRSTDGGANWNKVSFPYRGSMFGLIAWGDDRVMAFGLRGNVYESSNGGASWSKIETGVNTSLMGGTALENGGAVLVGANGIVLQRDSADAAFSAKTFQNANGETPVLSGVASVNANQWLLIGDKGADLYSVK
jgi:photosystem II stability/assembly factor-like uncharacterized protein